MDRGSLRLVLLVVALFFAIVLTLIGFDVVSSEYALGWLGLWAISLTAAFIA